MKYLLIIVFLISAAGTAQDLNAIRSAYPKAVESAEITAQLDGELAAVNASDKPVLLAYKGAVLTLKAKFAKRKKDKLDFFKEGIALIDGAIQVAPQSIEIHLVRMSVQENSPRFLGYHKDIAEDKAFILKDYKTISSSDLKKLVKDFVLKSGNFDDSEKKSFQ